ncbi:MAG: hypothetical protein ACKPJH_06795 [Dolichospermum sp.]
MNATQLANVLQNIKTDPVLQETLRVTKQDWVELNLTTQEILQASMNIASAPEFSDREIEYILHGAIGMGSNEATCKGYTCGSEAECRLTSFTSTCD